LKALIFLISFVAGIGWDQTRTRKKHPCQAFLPCSVEITKIPLWMPPGPENQFRETFLQQHTDETPMLARGDEGGRATVYNAHLAHRFPAVSYELATSLELACCMHDLAAAYTQ